MERIVKERKKPQIRVDDVDDDDGVGDTNARFGENVFELGLDLVVAKAWKSWYATKRIDNFAKNWTFTPDFVLKDTL